MGQNIKEEVMYIPNSQLRNLFNVHQQQQQPTEELRLKYRIRFCSTTMWWKLYLIKSPNPDHFSLSQPSYLLLLLLLSFLKRSETFQRPIESYQSSLVGRKERLQKFEKLVYSLSAQRLRINLWTIQLHHQVSFFGSKDFVFFLSFSITRSKDSGSNNNKACSGNLVNPFG